MKLPADRQTPARSLVNSVWCEPTTKIVKSSKKCYIQFNVYRILVTLDESLKWVSWQWFRKVVSMSLGWRSTSFFFAGTYLARRLREVCYLFYASQHIEGARKRSRRQNRREEQISLFSLSAFSFLHFYYKLHSSTLPCGSSNWRTATQSVGSSVNELLFKSCFCFSAISSIR